MSTINEELRKLYKRYISTMWDNQNYYPFLMQCPKEYEKAKIKIMFVGNDIKNFTKKDTKTDFTVDDAIEKNKKNEQNPVKQFASLLNEKVNEKNHNDYLVTELFMLGEYTGSLSDFDASERWRNDNYSILKKEVKICKPDCVVFLTQVPSMEDTFLLKGLLGSETVFMPTSDCSDVTLIQYAQDIFGKQILLIRVPKPQKTLSKKAVKIAEISSKLIKNRRHNNGYNTKINLIEELSRTQESSNNNWQYR